MGNQIKELNWRIAYWRTELKRLKAKQDEYRKIFKENNWKWPEEIEEETKKLWDSVDVCKNMIAKLKKEKAGYNKEYSKIYAQADAAGMERMKKFLGNNDDYYGACGFAWVKIYNGRSSFARWLKDMGYVTRRAWDGGVDIWVSCGGQSIDVKEKYAIGMAEVLKNNGIACSARSRLD